MMKKLALLLGLCMLLLLVKVQDSKAQSFNYRTDSYCLQTTIDFEKPSPYIILNNDSTNIWEIGMPQKSYFKKAIFGNYSLVTGLTKPYPPNNISSFLLKDTLIDTINKYYPCIIQNVFIDFLYGVQTDSLKDLINLFISTNDGISWIPLNKQVFEDSLRNSWDFYNSGTLKKNLYTFSWFPGKQEYHPSKMLVKFEFTSDSIDNKNDGVMIDEILITKNYEVSINNNDNEPEIMIQNPIVLNSEIRYKNIEPTDFNIYDIYGKEVLNKDCPDCISISSQELNPGLFILKVNSKQGISYLKKIIVQ